MEVRERMVRLLVALALLVTLPSCGSCPPCEAHTAKPVVVPAPAATSAAEAEVEAPARPRLEAVKLLDMADPDARVLLYADIGAARESRVFTGVASIVATSDRMLRQAPKRCRLSLADLFSRVVFSLGDTSDDEALLIAELAVGADQVLTCLKILDSHYEEGTVAGHAALVHGNGHRRTVALEADGFFFIGGERQVKLALGRAKATSAGPRVNTRALLEKQMGGIAAVVASDFEELELAVGKLDLVGQRISISGSIRFRSRDTTDTPQAARLLRDLKRAQREAEREAIKLFGAGHPIVGQIRKARFHIHGSQVDFEVALEPDAKVAAAIESEARQQLERY